MARNPAAMPNPAKIADEQATVLDMRRKGFSVRRIAQETGIPRSTVQDRLDAAIAELVLPLADEVRLIELERLDTWQARLEERLEDGEDPVRVVPVAVKVSESRRKLLGSDEPDRLEHTVPVVTDPDGSTASVLDQARQAAADRIARLRESEGQG